MKMTNWQNKIDGIICNKISLRRHYQMVIEMPVRFAFSSIIYTALRFKRDSRDTLVMMERSGTRTLT